MKSGFAWTAALAVVLCLCVGLAIGQAGNNGTISGVIQESNGTPIPGVRISLLNVGSGAAARPVTVTTDANGAYSFANIAPGTYTVTAELAGFQTARYSRIELAARQTLKLDFKLRDGAVSSPVELSLNPPKEEDKKVATLQPPLPPLAEAAPSIQAPQPPPVRTTPPSASAQQNRGNNNANAQTGAAGQRGGGAPGGGGGRGAGAGNFGGVLGGTLGGTIGGGIGGGPPATGAPGPAPGVVVIDRADRIVILPPNYPRPTSETYERIADNPFLAVASDPLATLAVDVDTASYSNIRRFLRCRRR
jgi:hypothetical protein